MSDAHIAESDAAMPEGAQALMADFADGRRLYCPAVLIEDGRITPVPGYHWEWLAPSVTLPESRKS